MASLNQYDDVLEYAGSSTSMHLREGLLKTAKFVIDVLLPFFIFKLVKEWCSKKTSAVLEKDQYLLIIEGTTQICKTCTS